jgi:guanylate kinase
MQGKLIIVSAPSGAGKTTIVKKLMEGIPRLEFSVSACSRARRHNEVHGRDYYFLSAAEFRDKISRGEFLEWEEVYPGSYYGTLRSEVERIWGKGNHVVFDVDVMGGLHIKQLYPGKSLALFILPPSVGELESRLRKRSTDSAGDIQIRVEKAREELALAGKFDKVILNDKLEDAIEEAMEAVRSFLA